MPLDGFALLCVVLESCDWFCHMFFKSCWIINMPKLDSRIVWRRTEQLIMERIELQVSNCSLMAFDQRDGAIESFVVICAEASNGRSGWPVDSCKFTIASHTILFIVNSWGDVLEFFERICYFSVKVFELQTFLDGLSRCNSLWGWLFRCHRKVKGRVLFDHIFFLSSILN